MKRILNSVYNHRISRVLFKIAILYLPLNGLLEYQQARKQNTVWRLYRFCQMEFSCPINPPLINPYPYSMEYDKIQIAKQSNRIERIAVNNWIAKDIYRKYFYTDEPCRQNPNRIDHLIEYSRIYNYDEYQKIMLLNKLAEQSGDLPDEINSMVRRLQQYTLNFHRPLVPQL